MVASLNNGLISAGFRNNSFGGIANPDPFAASKKAIAKKNADFEAAVEKKTSTEQKETKKTDSSARPFEKNLDKLENDIKNTDNKIEELKVKLQKKIDKAASPEEAAEFKEALDKLNDAQAAAAGHIKTFNDLSAGLKAGAPTIESLAGVSAVGAPQASSKANPLQQDSILDKSVTQATSREENSALDKIREANRRQKDFASEYAATAYSNSNRLTRVPLTVVDLIS